MRLKYIEAQLILQGSSRPFFVILRNILKQDETSICGKTLWWFELSSEISGASVTAAGSGSVVSYQLSFYMMSKPKSRSKSVVSLQHPQLTGQFSYQFQNPRSQFGPSNQRNAIHCGSQRTRSEIPGTWWDLVAGLLQESLQSLSIGQSMQWKGCPQPSNFGGQFRVPYAKQKCYISAQTFFS